MKKGKRKFFGGLGIREVRTRIPLSTRSKEEVTLGGNYVSPGRKGQASIEFLAFLILIMIVSVAVYAGVLGRLSSAASSQSTFGLQSACRNIANGINSAYVFGNGFSSNMTLPQEASASMLNNLVVCIGGDKVFIESALGNVRNSTGAANFNFGRQVKIANSLGTIIIS